ncbi:MAG: hypothetical protein E6Q97_38590 [Desulfurellales bacterium]|nr:MAG: hypothetical protein E6Q97_38590 [Desulfurellales bacterium]
MKITAVEVHNFKRIQDIRIEPAADRELILIGGKNAQGKSSLLDAMTAALGGAKTLPSDPVRHGAPRAEIIVELDDGMTVTRQIDTDGTSTLEVRDKLGAIKAPQQALDKLFAGRSLDPLAFLALKPKEQRAELMKLIPDAKRIDELDGKRQRAFDRRTEVGRDLTKAEGELARLPDVVDPPQPVDVKALTEELRELQELQRQGDKLQADVTAANNQVNTATLAVESLRNRAAALRAEADKLDADANEREVTIQAQRAAATKLATQLAEAAKAWQANAARREALDDALTAADETNRAAYAAKAAADRRAETAEMVAKLAKERHDLTEVLKVIDDRKAAILKAASQDDKLPVAGLSIDDEQITLNGVPLSQASGAERLRVALAMAIAANPTLDDIWVRDAALLDEESVQLVATHAATAGKRVWLERVGTSDAGVIVISEGKVVAP